MRARRRKAKRTSMISIRLEPKQHDFLKKHNLSATKIMNEAIKRTKRMRKW